MASYPEKAALARENGHRITTLYIGGGTPTTLTAEQLNDLMGTVAKPVDVSSLLEYTVEGGRPDTLDAKKLLAIRTHGADRMSINPQTMVDRTLQVIGRAHTAAQVEEAYAMARAEGIGNINMDVIAGLPGDTPEILQKRIMEQAEWILLPEAVRAFCEDRITVSGRTVIIH